MNDAVDSAAEPRNQTSLEALSDTLGMALVRHGLNAGSENHLKY
jgi:hypothetical protein